MARNNPTITSIETLRNPEYPRIVWVRIGSSDGLFGLGETSFEPATVETWVHENAANYLLGKDATRLDEYWDKLNGHGARLRSRSAEMSGLSAVDMALWDLGAKRLNVPLYELLGGLSRDRIRIYNTCAGYSYGVKRPGRLATGEVDYRPEQPYEDQHAFLTDAGALADDLLSQGITAMKIWPFDQFVDKTNGQFISMADLDEGTEPFRKIRQKVGNRMDVMVEMHSLWNLSSAIRVAKSVEPTDPFWFEDPVPMDNIDALAEFNKSTHIATTASEIVATRWGFREMMQKQAMTICMFDISWVGGISEAKRISTMAETYRMPVAPHDCVGPVTLAFSVQLSLNAPNALIQETVRAYNETWYLDIVDKLPRIESGFAYPGDEAGIGMTLLESFEKHPDTTSRLSEA